MSHVVDIAPVDIAPVDVAPLYAAADTVAGCAARIRAQQLIVAVLGAAPGWLSPAGWMFRSGLTDLVAELAGQADRLDQFAEQILQTAAALQLGSAVQH